MEGYTDGWTVNWISGLWVTNIEMYSAFENKILRKLGLKTESNGGGGLEKTSEGGFHNLHT
jgi:hypothetical protein